MREEKFTKMFMGITVNGKISVFIASVESIDRFVVCLNHFLLQACIVFVVCQVEDVAGYLPQYNGITGEKDIAEHIARHGGGEPRKRGDEKTIEQRVKHEELEKQDGKYISRLVWFMSYRRC